CCCTLSWMPARLYFLNPCAVTSTVYEPGGNNGAVKLPASLDAVVRRALVPALTTSTCAPATAAPLLSVTVPTIVPVAVCAHDPVEAQTSSASARRRLFIAFRSRISLESYGHVSIRVHLHC